MIQAAFVGGRRESSADTMTGAWMLSLITLDSPVLRTQKKNVGSKKGPNRNLRFCCNFQGCFVQNDITFWGCFVQNDSLLESWVKLTQIGLLGLKTVGHF